MNIVIQQIKLPEIKSYSSFNLIVFKVFISYFEFYYSFYKNHPKHKIINTF